MRVIFLFDPNRICYTCLNAHKIETKHQYVLWMALAHLQVELAKASTFIQQYLFTIGISGEDRQCIKHLHILTCTIAYLV